MINAVNVPVQTVLTNGTVLFASTRIHTGCSVRHEEGSGRFVALKPGVYEVSFSGNVALPAGTTPIAPISVDITIDGEPIAGSKMLTTPAAAATPGNIATTVLIRVFCDCCVAIGVRNTGTTSITVQDANLVITREC